jgi:hypothetical protein
LGGEGRGSPSANPRLFLIPTDQQFGVGWSNQSLSSSETESQIDENLFQVCRCDSDFSNSQLAHSPPFVVPFGRHCFVCFGEKLETQFYDPASSRLRPCTSHLQGLTRLVIILTIFAYNRHPSSSIIIHYHPSSSILIHYHP